MLTVLATLYKWKSTVRVGMGGGGGGGGGGLEPLKNIFLCHQLPLLRVISIKLI